METRMLYNVIVNGIDHMVGIATQTSVTQRSHLVVNKEAMLVSRLIEESLHVVTFDAMINFTYGK
jgi:hypothetical protein